MPSASYPLFLEDFLMKHDIIVSFNDTTPVTDMYYNLNVITGGGR